MEKVITLLSFFFTGTSLNSGKKQIPDDYIYTVKHLFNLLIGNCKDYGWSTGEHHRAWASFENEIDKDGRRLCLNKDDNWVSSNYYVYLLLSAFVARIISFGVCNNDKYKTMYGYLCQLMDAAPNYIQTSNQHKHENYMLDLCGWSMIGMPTDKDADNSDSARVKKIVDMINVYGKRMLNVFKNTLRGM